MAPRLRLRRSAGLLLLLWVLCVNTIATVLATLSADDAQLWRAQNADYDWQQADPLTSQVRIVGRGVDDADGNLYFVGTKSCANANGEYIDDQNMFVARINADDSLGWTKEYGTNETDGANFIAIMNETSAGTTTQFLYVVGWTWGFMDDGGHALNGFGRFGGRDVVLLKLSLTDGSKLWARQFGSTVDDIGYGVQRDGAFDSLLLTGASVSDQTDAVMEMDVDIQTEPRQQPFSLYETQLMDARARQSSVSSLTRYQFAASLSRQGDVLDFTMDGGVTLSPRRQRIAENSSLVGEYAVVLNRQPLDEVTVLVSLVGQPDPGDDSAPLVHQLSFLKTADVTQKTLLFTRSNWNREQLVRVVPVDDAAAEGVHYAVITHETSSRDPHFNGPQTPFLYGHNVTMQIDDNDVAGIQLSRRHVFVAEGNANDSYEIMLRSRPWHPVEVSIVSLHGEQAIATPSVVTFEPQNWNIPQVVTVSAVDDDISENEYGGLHFGGRLLHYSSSLDRRYHSRRPKCYDVPRCDPQNPSDCLDFVSFDEIVRVCDLSPLSSHCIGRLGNGACITQVSVADGTLPPARFGWPMLLATEPGSDQDSVPLTYAAMRDLLQDQADDVARVAGNVTYDFTAPPAELRGFVLSFLGLLNVAQAQQLHGNFYRSLQAVCTGLDRLATHRWVAETWPEGSFPRVLNATLSMFGGSVTERHLWQCGTASFRPGGSSINISIWDNDAGVTLSTRSLAVTETSNSDDAKSSGQYSIVLNAPPSSGKATLVRSYCSLTGSDSCGLWSDFQQVASSVYALRSQLPLPNVSIAIVGNAQVAVSPSLVTFTTANWFIPHWITVRAISDDVAEVDVANLTITHRVQNSALGYNDATTSFWFRGATPAMDTLFPRWVNSSEANAIAYNLLPSVVRSPQHKQINIQVHDDDAAGVIVTEIQPRGKVTTRESDDTEDDWVGDSVKSMGFSDISLTSATAATSASVGFNAALQSVLVFETNAVTFLKFHLPTRHEGDTQIDFLFAKIRVYETPFKVINASSSDASSSSSASTAFETSYQLRITVVDNAWTRAQVSDSSVDPLPVAFLPAETRSIVVTTLMTKQRFASIDVTPLVRLLLPTRLPVVSFKIEVLSSSTAGATGGSSSAVTTQLCSSLFERALRPALVVGYEFQNRLLGMSALQSSTLTEASFAVDGDRTGATSASTTLDESEPWWEATLPHVHRLGSLAIFLPPDMNSGDVVASPVVLFVVASLVSLDGAMMNLSTARTMGCPDACPLVQRLPVRKALVITELHVGVRTLRIYRQGTGRLQLQQVEAYDPHITLTPTANGAGLRARLKMDWNGRLRSSSWRLLQSTRQSEDTNVALGMPTRQSSTDPSQAVSSLAVDGQQASEWDSLLWTKPAESIDQDGVGVAGSTRTQPETDPWWEVDLGVVVPIASVVLYPYVGARGRSFCQATSAAPTVPSWAGDLVSFSKTDELLQMQDPFEQIFEVTLSDTSRSVGGGASGITKSVPFSCAGGVISVAWTDVFAKARYVTVTRRGSGVVLMLKEVVVTRWNPATTPQYVLLDLRGSGDAPLALSSIQLFPPTDDTTASTAFTLPLSYTIHSVSSQRAATGDGSALALLSAATSDCYVAAQASYREWIVLKVSTATQPARVGLIDVQTAVDKCGAGVSPILSLSVSVRGASLDGLRSTAVEASLASVESPTSACSLTALATLSNPSADTSGCASFFCGDASCRATLTTTDSLVVFSDFNDVVLLGIPTLTPTTRLPLSQHESRAMLLRDNPVVLWSFDTEPRATISPTRTSSVYTLTSSASSKALDIDDALEQSFFSNAVAVQPAMSAFSIELWIQLTAAPLTVSSTTPTVTLVTLASTGSTAKPAVLADVSLTAKAPKGVFTIHDPISGATCVAKLPPTASVFDTVGRWYHLVAAYDPSNARLLFSVRYETTLSDGTSDTVSASSSSTTCSLPLLSASDKFLQVGAFPTLSAVGFVGRIANAAWYVAALTDRQSLDHFHDFLQRGRRAPLHNSYAVRLASKPTTPVTVEVNAETACYYFALCNVTALPRTLRFAPEDWNKSQFVRVLATDDQLYEAFHTSLVVHKASSMATYETQSVASTQDLVGADAASWEAYKRAVFVYDRAATYTFPSLAVIEESKLLLNEFHANWSTQSVVTSLVARHPYSDALAIRSVRIEIEDATVPGIQFSTGSLVVSESGKGNDYQILLLSEPTSDVYVMLDAQSDCYRHCFAVPLCPSQATDAAAYLSCGGGSAGMKLCNITVFPDVLVFTPTNWTFPQTVRVLAVDDRLDEADVHMTTIKATSRSLDPIYHALFLPDIVVAVEDNDDTAIAYSTLEVSLTESGLLTSRTQYDLTLLTEPWANVTIAMSNEADGLCYRPCGYPFDEKDCGLPRQQSVSSVRLATDSPREIHQIKLLLPTPRVMEVQRVTTYVDHVDHIYNVRVTGGFTPHVQVIAFTFNSAFKTRFKSAAAMATAGTYMKSFKLGTTGKATLSASIDGFATAAQVESALNALLISRSPAGSSPSVVRVSREVLYEQSVLRWQVTFLRFLGDDLQFPMVTIVADTPFEGALSVQTVSMMAEPNGTLTLQYGADASTDIAQFSLSTSSNDIEASLRDISGVFTVIVSRAAVMASSDCGFTYGITFTSVEKYETLHASYARSGDNSTTVAATTVAVTERQVPAKIDGAFVILYDSPYVNASANVTTKETNAILWNATEATVAAELAALDGVGAVGVVRRQLSPEGAMDWTVVFIENNGHLPLLQVKSVNLTGKGVATEVTSVVEGVSLGGSFSVEMGGPFIRTHPTTKRVYVVETNLQNTTQLPFNSTAETLVDALVALELTEPVTVTRENVTCDAFDVCEGFVWTITYTNSAGNLPPIQVYGTNESLTGDGATITARTVANGTYLSGYFSLQLELNDSTTNVAHSAKTWNLPVNVSAAGMDEALEAIRFVRSNREAEFDPETRVSRGWQFDKGVRVVRDGPYLDGGYTWRLEWAIEDYVRFQDLRISINTTLVTQLLEPLAVASELDLSNQPRCDAIPHAKYKADDSDPFGLRGFCVYDLVNVTIQERFLCNYTVENPWVVFTPENWCLSQSVELTAVDDFIDEATVENGNTTYSNVTHTVFSDDLIYTALPLKPIQVAVENDDVAKVVVSETHLDVSEDGAVVAFYELTLTSEPLYDVRIVVLPWLDSADTKCYRFELCNLTLPVDTYVFTPRDWDIPQRVVVRATDDDLDEYDTHDTGLSHVSYSDDFKYHQRKDIPTIHVTVTDNDNSAFYVDKAFVNVTEGGQQDVYTVVLRSEPFAKVTVEIQNIGIKGNFATATPSKLLFTWRDWNVSQTVTVAAVDDATQDPMDSSSVLAHAIRTNDLIYAGLQNLASVAVYISDDDLSGIEISTLAMDVVEQATAYKYDIRLTSEPWFPVVVTPNGNHNCYVRASTQDKICNVSVLTNAVYFGAGNWSQWQSVAFLAFDDSLEETPIHMANITHSTSSKDTLYTVVEYPDQRLALAIKDNDISYVEISLASRSRLHVAEGGFNDSYRIVLQSEPYEDVLVTVRPRIDRIVSVDTAVAAVDAPQVGASWRTGGTLNTGDLMLVFTPLDWATPRIITVFAIDDEIPEDPTQFSVISHESLSDDAKYNISNSSLGIVDVAVLISDREAIPPPLPTSALFDATGTRVVVTFDSTVYHAATMDVKAASTGSAYAPRFKSFACPHVFSSKLTSLGTGATCAWFLNLKQLQITLGVGATIVPGDVLLVYDCAAFVNQICQSTNVLRARHTSRAYTQATITLQVNPNAIAKPHIVLNMPEQVGSCGGWKADASLSTGSAGRPFKEQSWFALPRSAVTIGAPSADLWYTKSKTLYKALEPLCAKYAHTLTPWNKADLSSDVALFVQTLDQLRSVCYLRSLALASSSSGDFQLPVNSSLLSFDTSYVVGLSLINAFSQQTVAIQSVYVRKLPSPTVVAVGETAIQLTRGESQQRLTLQADATLDCLQLWGANPQLVFRWFATVADTDNPTNAVAVDLNATNTAKDPRVFHIPRSQFQAGKTYRLRCDATAMQASGITATGSVTFTVTVLISPVVAVMHGGDRSVGEKDTLVLNGTTSVDPDATTQSFSYTWRCEDWTNETLASIEPQPCINASSISQTPVRLPTASLLSSTLTMDPFTLQPKRTFRFFLTVAKTNDITKQTRRATTQTIVWTLQGSVPEVSIESAATKINPTSRLSITAAVKSTYPFTTRWLEDEGDLHLPDAASNVTTHGAFSMALTSPTNVIMRNTLTPGQRYVLRLVATDVNGNVGFALLTIMVNAPPTPGLFAISPRIGYAMVDQFTLSCTQWTDDASDLPLTYSYGVLSTSVFDQLAMNMTLIRQRMRPLVADQVSPTARATMLPPDGLADSDNVKVVAFVMDNMGSVAMAYDSITIEMPPDAMSKPVQFASGLLSDTASSRDIFSAALVMQRAMDQGNSSAVATKCPGAGTDAGVCSGKGVCDLATFVCVCGDGAMGPSCQFEIAEIRKVNNKIFSSLGGGNVQNVEPSDAGLSQQAHVVATVLQSSAAAIDASAISQVTSLSRGVASNALTLDDPSVFVESTGKTLLSSSSSVLSIRSTASGKNTKTQKGGRRLADASASTSTDSSSSSSSSMSATSVTCGDDDAATKTSFLQLLETLQSLALIASGDLLPDEAPEEISAGQITTIAGAGSRLSSSLLSVNLTNVAIACLSSIASTSSESTASAGTDLYISAFVLPSSTHSPCSLQDASPISSSTVVTVHNKATITTALSKSRPSGATAIALQSLTSSSVCVAQATAAAAAATASSFHRRRLAADGSTTVWTPLVALSIPHSRELTLVEQRNFSTSCRAWNAQTSAWESDVCFKDPTQSSTSLTVCYCSELRISPSPLEVIVTLEERLDFYALTRDLYRDDTPSIVGPVAMAALLALFAIGGKLGQRMDDVDNKKDKEKTIKNLNRSKWGELQERVVQATATEGGVRDEFASYIANRAKMQPPSQSPTQNQIYYHDSHTTALTATVVTSEASQLTITMAANDDVNLNIPNETRVLFGSSVTLQRQYSSLLLVLRGCNAVLAVLGLVAVLVGLDFYLVLGATTSSELVLFLYGAPIGLVLLLFGGVLLVSGLWGYWLCRPSEQNNASSSSSTRLARTSYATLLLLSLVGQFFFVFLAFRYLDDLNQLPLVAVDSLRAVWNAHSSTVRDEIQQSYGCCGFTSITDDSTSNGCPEEALDASPPRTCLIVVQDHARQLFHTSFGCLQVVFLVEVACLVVIHTLRSWRQRRLSQLAGAAANAPANGEPWTHRHLLSSAVDIVLLCSLPSILKTLLCLMALVLFSGIDLLAQLSILSNTLMAGLLGMEIGIVSVVVAVVYALILSYGLHALRKLDTGRLQSFTALTTAFLLASIALYVFVDRMHDHWLLDPAIVDVVHGKYVRLPRETLVAMETSLECCGFDSASEGSCVADSTLPTCRPLVLKVIHHELSILSGRLVVFIVIQAVVLAVAALAAVRVKRFRGLAPHQIQPVDAAAGSGQRVSFAHTLVFNSSVVVVLLISAAVVVFGLVVLGAGIDATYQFNVLHLSYLLRLFDRHVAVYLLSSGGAITAFGALGLVVAYTRNRRVAYLSAAVCLALFVALFGLSGFAFRYAHMPLHDDALNERLESFWISTPPKTTRVFLQNALACCGFEKIERANGSVVFTNAAEWSAWKLDQDAVETDTYSASISTNTSSPSASQHQRRSRRLSVTLRTPRRLTQVVCPVDATQGCALPLKSYVRRAASRAFQLCVALLVGLFALCIALGGIFWQPPDVTPKASWTLTVVRGVFLLLCVASLFVALASLVLGIDIATHWSLFTSSLLQLVFPRSIGVAFFMYAVYLFVLNAYALQGVLQGVVHRVFLQSLGRGFLILAGLVCVALTGYTAAHYTETKSATHLGSFLDRQWDTLTPLAQHRISLEFQCCGFNDPVVVKGHGLVFDRQPLGYACSLAAARGCRHMMEAQIGGSFTWLAVFFLVLTLVECLTLGVGLWVLQDLRRVKAHEWFVIESRIRFAAGKYKSELRKTHVLLSLSTQFDRKYTRAQRLTSVLCGLATTLAVYCVWFAHHGCHRHALKTCRQPDAWGFLGMGLVYGGLLGFACQLVARGLFEAVRNRSDDETQEVAVARQRKEKALLFRGLSSSSRTTKRATTSPGFSDLTDKGAAVVSPSSSLLDPPSHATTEERWYTWLARFTHSLFCALGVLLFLVGCALSTFMALVWIGVKGSLYSVRFDQGPKETLVFGVWISATALLAWFAVDLKQKKTHGNNTGGRSAVVFVGVAIASTLLVGGMWLGVFMASQTLEEDATNWTIRNTGFSVPEKLQDAWTRDTTGYFRHRVQQELQCCGFKSAQDTAFRPCPQGTTVLVDYEAVRVDGRVQAMSQNELRDLDGCYSAMIARFYTLLDQITYVAISVGVALVLFALSALFLARDVSISKDTKLKLRVTASSSSTSSDVGVRQTFEKVVGLKIAAPARGKILSKMLASSLDNVAPHVATELSMQSLASVQPLTGGGGGSLTLPTGQVVSSSLAVHSTWDAVGSSTTNTVPYPSWIVYVIFSLCGVWLAAMCYVIITHSLLLGVQTAWYCIGAWIVGVSFHVLLIEPSTVLMRILWATLGHWWATTMLARVLRYGRSVLRIRPSAEEEAARYYTSLSLYERIRYNAAVRIQRRLLTRLARRAFLHRVRENREQSHKQLVTQRRLILKRSIDGFTTEEIDAFRLLFHDADTARLGLVSYTVISQSIYQLGVRVDAALVKEFLLELDPAYADLVDFEHFLYGMHRVRVHHQEQQNGEAGVEAASTKAALADAQSPATTNKEQFVSSSSRFGPLADPQSRVFVKRQNLLRELKEKRESLSYKLLSKVGKLPPLLQRSRSGTPTASEMADADDNEGEDAGHASELMTATDEAPPTGSYVLLQNRKLSPKKRALEMILKKKSRDDKATAASSSSSSGNGRSSPKTFMQSLRMPGVSGSPRTAQKRDKVETLSMAEETAFAVIPEENEAAEAGSSSPVKAAMVVDAAEAVDGQGESETGRVAAAVPAEEAKPFGTFMLLAKHTSSAGKAKVLEKIQQKQSSGATKSASVSASALPSDTALAGSAAAVAAEVGSDKDKEKDDAAVDTTGQESRPTTAEKRERAHVVAKSSLEKALKKKQTQEAAKAVKGSSSPTKR